MGWGGVAENNTERGRDIEEEKETNRETDRQTERQTLPASQLDTDTQTDRY